MGAWYHTLQLRGLPRERAIAALERFVVAGAGAHGRRFAVGRTPAAGGWLAVYPDEMYGPRQVGELARAEPGLRGVYLWTADSESWGADVIADGALRASYASDDPDTSVETLAATARDTLAVGGDSTAIERALAALPEAGEDAMDAFARWLRIAGARASFHEAKELPGVELVEPLAGSERTRPLDAIVWALLRERPHALDALVAELARRAAPFEGTVTARDEGPHRTIVQAYLPALLEEGTPDPAATRALDPRGALAAGAFERLGAHYAFVALVPADDDSPELDELVTWPPKGHFADYLSADLVSACGGHEQLRQALPEHEFQTTADGGLIASLPLPPEQATSARARALRAAFAQALEGCAK